MTAQGRYAAPDSQFGRSAGNAAARGGALIAVAVVIGFLLLWRGGVGGSGEEVTATNTNDDTTEQTDDQQTEEDSTDGGAEEGATDGGTEDGSTDGGTEDGSTDGATDGGTTEETTDTTAPVVTRAPNEVSVAVANGVGEAGLAGARESVLSTAGYVTAAVNAAAETAQSAVYYVEGYGEEAQAIAIELGGDASVLRPAPADPGALVGDPTVVEGFNVFVILGTDRVLG